MISRIALLVSMAFFCSFAQAHKSSDSYLSLNINERGVTGQWDIALRDLGSAVEIDVNNDGEITWGEVRRAQTAISSHALTNLRIEQGAMRCPLRDEAHTLVEHSDGVYLRIPLAAQCDLKSDLPLTIGYTLLRGIDAQHRGLLALTSFGAAVTRVLDPAATPLQSTSADANSSRSMLDFIGEGMHHIVIGIDHVLFVALLVVATLRDHANAFRSAIKPLIKVVTAFTIAHSITLALAVFGWVNLPTRWVETLIALSVFVCAIDVFRPFLRGPRWMFAFGFGLLHGLGLASALTALTLAPEARISALFGFNVGVEIGQLAIALVALSGLHLLSRTATRATTIARFASIPIAAIALIWMVERSAEVKLLPM
jgi:HupE / UreJ protein